MNMIMLARELQAKGSRDRYYAMFGLPEHAARRIDLDIVLPEQDYGPSLDDVTKGFDYKNDDEKGDANILTTMEDIRFRHSTFFSCCKV
jgi:hypothetical protein